MSERRRGVGYAVPVSMAARGYSYARVRNTLQIPFDDSIDASNALECFFQMPTNVDAIRQAKVWVQIKNFRAYEQGAASGGGSTSSSANVDHQHAFNSSVSTGGTTGPGSTDSHTHSYTDLGAGVTSTNSTSTSHAHSVSAHTHSMTYGIFETAASGTLSLFVADDGTTYGSALTTGASSISGLDIRSQLTKGSGDKRIKITGTGLMRVQVLLLLDLVLIPLGPGQQ